MADSETDSESPPREETVAKIAARMKGQLDAALKSDVLSVDKEYTVTVDGVQGRFTIEADGGTGSDSVTTTDAETEDGTGEAPDAAEVDSAGTEPSTHATNEDQNTDDVQDEDDEADQEYSDPRTESDSRSVVRGGFAVGDVENVDNHSEGVEANGGQEANLSDFTSGYDSVEAFWREVATTNAVPLIWDDAEQEAKFNDDGDAPTHKQQMCIVVGYLFDRGYLDRDSAPIQTKHRGSDILSKDDSDISEGVYHERSRLWVETNGGRERKMSHLDRILEETVVG